jgi:hypothetical protein
MGAEQREAMRERSSRRDLALARTGSACVALWALALPVAAAGWARAEDRANEGATLARRTRPATKITPPPGPVASESVRQPRHTRKETGRVADPSALHGDSRIADANATEPADEHVVRPIPPASTLEPPPFADATQPPPEPAATAVAPGNAKPAPQDDPAPPSPAATATPPPAFIRHPSDKNTPPEDALLASAGERTFSSQPSQSAAATPLPKPTQPSKPENQVALDPLDQIRVEIRGRLPAFRACADAARRRTGLEMRRLQATWFIAADGTIKELKIHDVPDAQLATCLVHAGSRPFSNPPGMDLAIPTPIVFVR